MKKCGALVVVLGAPTSDAKLFPIRARQAPHALTRSFIEFPFFADYYEFYLFFNLQIKPSNLSTPFIQVITVTTKNLLLNSLKVWIVISFTKKNLFKGKLSAKSFFTCYLVFNFRPTSTILLKKFLLFSIFCLITPYYKVEVTDRKRVGPNKPFPVVMGLKLCNRWETNTYIACYHFL